MSVHVSSPVWKFCGLTPTEKLVLLRLADCANEDGESIYPAVSTIMRETGLKESTVRQALRNFRNWKIIIPDGKHNRRRTVIYSMNMDLIRKGFRAYLEGLDGVQQAEGPADGGSSTWTHEGPAGGPNTSFNRQEEETPIVPYDETPPEDYADDFEKLWAAWTPFEMLHGDRPQAERKYAKIRSEGVGADRVLLAARVYCQQCRNTRCKTKHIENWLGQCVWKPEEKVLGEGSNGKSRDKKTPTAEAEKPRALRHQRWHATAKQQLGDTVYRAWIERLWLEGDIVYCPTRFAAEYVQQQYGRALVAAIGHEVRYLAEMPPQHALADFVEHPAGENNGQDQITA